MRTEELYRRLSYGELANHAVSVDATGTIKQAAQPRVLQFANEALGKLYSRFLLAEGEEPVTLVAGQTRYPLRAADAIKILAVYTAFGESLPLDEAAHPGGLAVPAPNVLQVPVEADHPTFPPGAVLDVAYQSRHPVLTGALDQEIALPEALEEALTAYVGFKVYRAMNTQEAQQLAAGLEQRFRQVCDDSLLESLVHQGGFVGNTKFAARGWV